MENFYPNQYKEDKSYKINHNYLSKQFSCYEEILELIKDVVLKNDFTLGNEVDELEKLIAIEANTKFAIGVGSGTDAIRLSLKSLGIGEGDEVITTPYTFYATIGAIATTGAIPVFADVCDDYNLNPLEVEKKITKKTKAIVPVHWSGRPCQMDELKLISKQHNLPIVEDACHAIQAEYKNKRCGGIGKLGCFSFHPLKNLNVWGDGGIITTNDEELANRLKLIRNHGLIDRNTCIEFAYNSRLDTVQAVVAKFVLQNKLDAITKTRRNNSFLLDKLLAKIPFVSTVNRKNELKESFHLYMFSTDRKEKIYNALRDSGIDAKVHYPVPMHLQPAAKEFGYQLGDFPKAEKLAETSISIPVHEFITDNEIIYMSKVIESC